MPRFDGSTSGTDVRLQHRAVLSHRSFTRRRGPRPGIPVDSPAEPRMFRRTIALLHARPVPHGGFLLHDPILSVRQGALQFEWIAVWKPRFGLGFHENDTPTEGPLRGRSVRGPLHGHLEPEGASRARSAHQSHRAAVDVDGVFHDREPETRATGHSGPAAIDPI